MEKIALKNTTYIQGWEAVDAAAWADDVARTERNRSYCITTTATGTAGEDMQAVRAVYPKGNKKKVEV